MFLLRNKLLSDRLYDVINLSDFWMYQEYGGYKALVFVIDSTTKLYLPYNNLIDLEYDYNELKNLKKYINGRNE